MFTTVEIINFVSVRNQLASDVDYTSNIIAFIMMILRCRSQWGILQTVLETTYDEKAKALTTGSPVHS